MKQLGRRLVRNLKARCMRRQLSARTRVQRRPVAQQLLAHARLGAIGADEQAGGERRAAAPEVQGEMGTVCRHLEAIKVCLLAQRAGRQGAGQQGLREGRRERQLSGVWTAH